MEHSGVLVVRAWVEGRRAEGLRARITCSIADGLGEDRVTAAATIDEVCDEVRVWLESLVSAAEGASRESRRRTSD
jgi:hypothetical protein